MKEFINYGASTMHKKQALFASVFVAQNRLQTAGEKVQTEISMRQWHLLAMTQVCEKPKTLTEIGKLMGCSRQNVKNLASALRKKGFVDFAYGANNAVLIEITEKAQRYLSSMEDRHNEVLAHLFSEFSDREIDAFFDLQNKFLDGLARVERYAAGLQNQRAAQISEGSSVCDPS